MSKPKRVFAIRSADEETVWLYGIGTYVGDHPRPGSGPPWSQEDIDMVHRVIEDASDEDVDRLLRRLSLNPKIELDSGEVVWGCECWWVDLSRYDEIINGRNVVIVSVAEDRADAAVAAGRNLSPIGTDNSDA